MFADSRGQLPYFSRSKLQGKADGFEQVTEVRQICFPKWSYSTCPEQGPASSWLQIVIQISATNWGFNFLGGFTRVSGTARTGEWGWPSFEETDGKRMRFHEWLASLVDTFEAGASSLDCLRAAR
jgi:hypothetical protein